MRESASFSDFLTTILKKGRYKMKQKKNRLGFHHCWRQMPCCRAFNQMNVGVVFTLNGAVEFVNQQMCLYLKKSTRQLYGKSWKYVFRGNNPLIRSLLRAEEALKESDCCCYFTQKAVFPLCADRRVFRMMIYWIHPQNKKAGICWVFQDITDFISQKQLSCYEKTSIRVFELLRKSDGLFDERQLFYRLTKEIMTQYPFRAACFFSFENKCPQIAFSFDETVAKAYQTCLSKEACFQQSIVYKAMKTRRIICCRDVSSHPFYQEYLKSSEMNQFAAACAFPVIIHRNLQGVLCFYGINSDVFDYVLISHLKQLIRAVCLYVSEMRLRKKQQQSLSSLQQRLENQVKALEKNKTLMQKQMRESNKIVADLMVARHQATLGEQTQMNFLANVSHELRTPLNAVLGFAQILASETFGPLGQPVYKEYASFIQKSAFHLLGLINDILDVSRIEAGKVVLNETTVDLKKSLREALDLISQYPEAAFRQITLHFQGTVKLWADERALRQIFLNILSNAVKFTRNGGKIDIFVSRLPNGIQLVFQDNGIGIAADKIQFLFKPFTQIENIFTRSHAGSGLGLVLIKKMVILHQGTVRLESEEGQGTKVIVCFPESRIIT